MEKLASSMVTYTEESEKRPENEKTGLRGTNLSMENSITVIFDKRAALSRN
jgi:hypothetical protein